VRFIKNFDLKKKNKQTKKSTKKHRVNFLLKNHPLFKCKKNQVRYIRILSLPKKEKSEVLLVQCKKSKRSKRDIVLDTNFNSLRNAGYRSFSPTKKAFIK